MDIIFGIATLFFVFIIPILLIIFLIKPGLLKRFFKGKAPRRIKVVAAAALAGLFFFIIMAFTAPAQTPEDKTARENAAAIEQTQKDEIKNREADAEKLAIQQKLSESEAKEFKKQTEKQDKNNQKLAKKVKIHNGAIERGNDKEYTYYFVSNSNVYDVKINLLDKNKKVLASKNINHADKNWFIKSGLSPETIAYITYAVSINSKYYTVEKPIVVSKNLIDYPKIAAATKITNTKVTKENNAYLYSIESSDKTFDIKIELINASGVAVFSKSFNHKDARYDFIAPNAPVAYGGDVTHIKTYTSINNKFYDVDAKIVTSLNWQDKDEERAAEARKVEAARVEASRQAAAAQAAEQQRQAQAAAAQRQSQQTQTSSSSTYYKNCSAARAAGAAPVYRGQPGYGTHLDKDRDGVGCE